MGKDELGGGRGGMWPIFWTFFLVLIVVTNADKNL